MKVMKEIISYLAGKGFAIKNVCFKSYTVGFLLSLSHYSASDFLLPNSLPQTGRHTQKGTHTQTYTKRETHTQGRKKKTRREKERDTEREMPEEAHLIDGRMVRYVAGNVAQSRGRNCTAKR